MASQILRIIDAFIAEGYSTLCFNTEDGFPTASHFDVIVVKVADGRMFMLPNGKMVEVDGFRCAVAIYDAAVLLPKVQARGMIDPTLWVEQELEQETFEQRYAPSGTAWMEEQQARGSYL